jgi:predicted dehydrogenase
MNKFNSVKEIKAALIGYSPQFRMGELHANDMGKAGITTVAVCDINSEVLKAAVKNHPGVDTYTSVDEMLLRKDVNLVVIITPHNTHHDLAMKCLSAGKSVILEKPMAITTDQCDEMIRLAEKNGLMLTVYQSRHWDGWIKSAVKVVKTEKKIGEIVKIEAHMGGYGCPGDWWRSSKCISGGILYDWGVHLIEYCLQLIDSDVEEVIGFKHEGYWSDKCKFKSDTNEDDATAIVRFKSGQWMTLNITSIDANAKSNDRGFLEITGTTGTFIMDPAGWKLIKHEDGTKIVVTGPNMEPSWHDFYANIADHLVNGNPLIITAGYARKIINIIDLAVKSADRKK